MDRLESMSVLMAVVEAGSFSGAGRQLRMPVPTVSRKVAELEGHLKAKLLLRSTRKLALTETGHAYVAACRKILDDLAEAERGATGEYSAPRGELVITAPILLGRLYIVPMVAQFLAAYPDVSIRLVLSDGALDLIGDHLDLAVRIGELPDSRSIAARIGQVRHVVCASPDYFAAHGHPATPEQLAQHQCVTFTALAAPQSWVFRIEGALRTVSVRSRLTVNTADAAIEAALAGVGLARVISYQVAAPLAAGLLSLALAEFEPEPVPVHLVYTGAPPMAQKLRAFLDFATPRLRVRLQGNG